MSANMPTVGTNVKPLSAHFALFAMRPTLGTNTGMQNNLRKLRNARGWTQTEAATAMGTTRDQYVKLERGVAKGGRKLHEGWIMRAANAFGVLPEAIITDGDGGPDEMDPAGKPISSAAQPEPPSPPSGIPEFEVFAGASYAGGIDDEAWNESGASGHRPIATWGFPASFVEAELGLRIGHADIIKIRGDSMDDGSARGLASGDRVLIDRRDTDPRQGGIFAVWDGEGVVVKQVEIVRGTQPPQIVCKSLNPGFDPFTLTLDEGQAHIIGRVAGKITRM